jgi:hypothetical protein
MTDTRFIWAGGLQKSGGGDEGELGTVVELRWQLGFSFEAKLARGYMM